MRLLHEHYIRYQLEIDNIFSLINTVIIFLATSHCASCLWIFIGAINQNPNWMNEYGLDIDDKNEHTKIYVTAIYGSITTLTTVGYGDVKGFNEFEKVYLIALMFAGILIFTFLVEKIFSV